MTKWIPYVIAAVLGLGVAVLAFGPGMGGESERAEPVAKTETPAKKRPTVVDFKDKGFSVAQAPDDTRTPEEIVAEAKANPLPPPGTLRPQNQAEIEHSARLARPFNQHFAHVNAFWNRAAQLMSATDPELAQECNLMGRYLRDQGKLNDDAIDIKGTLEKEIALTEKLRAAAGNDVELTGVLDYIRDSSQAVLDGNDPTAVPKPAGKRAGG